MIEKRFWNPVVTSQYNVCCVPYHMDTYRGCPHDCCYCFARDFTTFSRRNSENKSFSYLVGNDAEKFKKWIKKVESHDIDYNKPEEVAFKERVPVKIGATSDPFPYAEEQEKITYEFLKIFKELDYPCQISTKNPEVFLSYAKEFVGMNMAFTVTITTVDDDFAKVIEPGAISPTRRFQAIKKLTDMGFDVLVRIHPFIYPHVIDTSDEIVKKVKECGAFGFMTEGLKYRVTMPENEQKIFQKIGDYLGFNMRQSFKENGVITGSDREYKPEIKEQVIRNFDRLAKENCLRYKNADNHLVKGVGCGSECCGTACLHNYRIFPLNKRTQMYKDNVPYTEHLQKCFVNFTRSQRFKGKTIEQAIEILNQNNQETLF